MAPILSLVSQYADMRYSPAPAIATELWLELFSMALQADAIMIREKKYSNQEIKGKSDILKLMNKKIKKYSLDERKKFYNLERKIVDCHTKECIISLLKITYKKVESTVMAYTDFHASPSTERLLWTVKKTVTFTLIPQDNSWKITRIRSHSHHESYIKAPENLL